MRKKIFTKTICPVYANGRQQQPEAQLNEPMHNTSCIFSRCQGEMKVKVIKFLGYFERIVC